MSRSALPATATAAAPALGQGGNAGLWWTRFCDRWSEEFTALADAVVRPAGQGRSAEKESGKLVWLKTLTAGPVGDGGLLCEHARRREELLRAHGHAPIQLSLSAPFVTGTGLEHPVENGFLFHHTLGVPYLPGSSVKGLVRAWAEIQAGPDRDDPAVRRILGPRQGGQGVGSVIFLDALPVAPVRLTVEVMTPHYGPWYQAMDPAASPPADWYDPTPIPFLGVAPGAVFGFGLLPNPTPDTAADDLATAEAWLKDALDWLGAGAKTAVGFGRFAPAETFTSEAAPARTKPMSGTVHAITDPNLLARFPPRSWVETPNGAGEIVGHSGGLVEVYLEDQGVRRRYPPDELQSI